MTLGDPTRRRLSALDTAIGRLAPLSGRTAVAGLVLAVAALAASVDAEAQSWWPFSGQQQEAPRPRAPVYRPPPAPIPPESAQPLARSPGSNSPICVQLEQRLIAEGQRGNQTRSQLPRIEDETRKTERDAQIAQQTLDRGDCYDTFFFSKTLRRTPQCVQAANQLDAAKRHLSELSAQRQELQNTSERSYQDDIIRELARNGCGANWTQEARKRDQLGDSIFGRADPEEEGTKGDNSFGNLPFATYRTVCVRLCDGFFFPVSFSTLPNHFTHDADQCQSHCAAPTDLYYYQNPGADIKQAMSVKSQTPYTNLKTAFRYTKEYVQGCSCKEAEYVPAAGEKKAEAPGAGGQSVPAGTTTTRQAARAP